jgi:hypothetical protein
LPKRFCGNEGVLECSGWTELGMVSSALIEKSKAVSSHRSPRKKDPESHAKTRRLEGAKERKKDGKLSHAKARRVGDRVPQLPKRFCGNEGVLECSGWTELGMGRERVDGENPKRCQATAVQERRIRNLTRRREGAKERKKEGK